MIDALYISASGLRSEQKQIDVISNNVANLQTPGFKRSRVNFVDVATAAVSGGQPVISDQRGDGTRIASTSAFFGAGELRPTNNPLDVAIEGNGFFEVQADDGRLLYTRDGQFRVDAEGNLVTVQGLKLARGLQIPAGATDVRIEANGNVSALLAGETDRTDLGTLELATFAAPDALESVGDNQYAATDLAGAPTYGQPGDTGVGRLQQGYVETSNVDMIEEMSSLVLAQRAYQLNARVLQASDQILETINNLRR
jgi:flagellar basal-body rod protein FlgG